MTCPGILNFSLWHPSIDAFKLTSWLFPISSRHWAVLMGTMKLRISLCLLSCWFCFIDTGAPTERWFDFWCVFLLSGKNDSSEYCHMPGTVPSVCIYNLFNDHSNTVK